MKIKEVIEFDPKKKYVILFPDGVKTEDINSARDVLDKWKKSKNPFLFLCGVKFKRVK